MKDDHGRDEDQQEKRGARSGRKTEPDRPLPFGPFASAARISTSSTSGSLTPVGSEYQSVLFARKAHRKPKALKPMAGHHSLGLRGINGIARHASSTARR
jgi:hypothetical protein